jgi:predicted DsbA family dithiol-disulfide isomerase
MNVDENVIEKLKKVLNLANRGGTQGEAEAAFRRAKEIAMRYNIDLASIEVGASAGACAAHQVAGWSKASTSSARQMRLQSAQRFGLGWKVCFLAF